MRSGDAQSAMLDIAAMYDRMAKRAAEREAKHSSPELSSRRRRYTILDGA
jgi:hypothetical protein